MKSSAKPEVPFAADGGLRPAPVRENDPYRALDELMAAVEALCPVWPARTEPTITRKMLL